MGLLQPIAEALSTLAEWSLKNILLILVGLFLV